MRKSIIQYPDGTFIAYGTDDKELNEYPPPHGLVEGAIGVVIHDDHRELTRGHDDHKTFIDLVHRHEYRNGKLYLKGGGAPLKAVCVEKLRMRNGALEDNTVQGWRRRAIFEPAVDSSGEEIEDEENEDPRALPLGQWYVMGPQTGEGGLNLTPISAPAPNDRRVWAGLRFNEIEPEQGVIPEE